MALTEQPETRSMDRIITHFARPYFKNREASAPKWSFVLSRYRGPIEAVIIFFGC